MSFTPNEAQQPVTEKEGWRDGPSHVGTCTHGWLTTTQFLSSVFVVENAANVPDRRIVPRTSIRPEIYMKRGEKWFSHRLNTIIHKKKIFLILEATLRYITLSGLSTRNFYYVLWLRDSMASSKVTQRMGKKSALHLYIWRRGCSYRP
jgi:hypothetical protein